MTQNVRLPKELSLFTGVHVVNSQSFAQATYVLN